MRRTKPPILGRPIFATAAYPTRHHALLMIYDTLYGVDDAFQPQPADGRGPCRRGCRPARHHHPAARHPAARVRDAVAPIRRWAQRDAMGQALFASPPFDNPGVRRALLGAVNQADYMTAVIGTCPSM